MQPIWAKAGLLVQRQEGQGQGLHVRQVGSLCLRCVDDVRNCEGGTGRWKGQSLVCQERRRRGGHTMASRHRPWVPVCGVCAGLCDQEALGSCGYKERGVHGVLRAAAKGCRR